MASIHPQLDPPIIYINTLLVLKSTECCATKSTTFINVIWKVKGIPQVVAGMLDTVVFTCSLSFTFKPFSHYHVLLLHYYS